MDGFFLVYKDQGYTSNNLVQKIKNKFQLKKVGHTGTLDSFAEGLMIVTIGRACAFSSFFLNMDKTYEATLCLGKLTDSGDPNGVVLKELNEELIQKTWENTWNQGELLRNTILSVKDWSTQEAPYISALKQNGKRLSDLYRSGVEVIPKTRPIRVEWVKILKFEPNSPIFSIRVSSGTYIRKIGLDISKILDFPISLKKLIRTSIGKWDISQAKPIEDLELKDLHSIQSLLPFPKFYLPKRLESKVLNGSYISLPNSFLNYVQEKERDGYFYLLNENGNLLAWCQRNEKNKMGWCYKKVFPKN